MSGFKDYCETCGKLSYFKSDEAEPLVCKRCEKSYDEDGTYHDSQRIIIRNENHGGLHIRKNGEWVNFV